MPKIWSLDDVDVRDKRVLLRLDLNVPMRNGEISDSERIEKILPTINELLEKNAKVIIATHLGRPKGEARQELSLKPISDYLQKALGQNIIFIPEITDGVVSTKMMKPGSVAMLENIRFYKGEEENDEAFAMKLAAFADIFVNDAFSVSHRAHASVEAITHLLPSYAGRFMQQEIKALTRSCSAAKYPILAVVGGAKVSTKLEVLKTLAKKVAYLVPAGGIANTFILAHNKSVGKSLCEPDMTDIVHEIEDIALKSGCAIIPPSEVVVVEKLEPQAKQRICASNELHYSEMIVDFGPKAVTDIYKIAQLCRTFIWNGPLGVFEVPPFDNGSVTLAKKIADLTQQRGLYSVAGGGETLTVLKQADVMDKFSYASTAGGAFLEWLEGKNLPGIEALKR